MESTKEALYSAYLFSMEHNFMVPLVFLLTLLIYCVYRDRTITGGCRYILGKTRKIIRDYGYTDCEILIASILTGIVCIPILVMWLPFDLMQDSRGRKLLVLAFTFVSLILYFFRPISHQEENTV